MSDLTAVKLASGEVFIDVRPDIRVDPLTRALEVIDRWVRLLNALHPYEESGLDEFHPDTTHNPVPTAPVDLGPAG